VTRDLRRLVLALLVCAVATLAEILGGSLTRSLALTADGLHSLVHVGALLVAIWGARPWSSGAPAEPGEAVVINALVILAIAAMLGFEGVSSLSAPEPVAFAPAIAVTLAGLMANLLTVLALGGGGPGDLNHRAVLIHMLGDAAVGVLALIGLASGAVFGLGWADPAAGLGGGLILAVFGGRLLLQSLAGWPTRRSHRA
jgi:Co/Zn/Cd efflux system component